MISCYFGEDSQSARREAREFFEQLRALSPAATAHYFDDVLFDIGSALDAFTAENLFGGENILYFDGILDHPDGESFYRTILKETSHSVIIREIAPSKDLKAFLERLGRAKEYPLAKKSERRIDSFPIVNALSRKDKKASWVEFERVRRAGISMEEVHGTIFWGVRTLLLVSMLDKQTALRVGVKEASYRSYFPLTKNFTVTELKDKLTTLKSIYHKGHRGEGVLEEMLEQYILS